MKIKSILLIILTLLFIAYAAAHIVAKKKLNNWIDQNKNITVENTSLNLLFGNLSLEDIAFNDPLYTTDTCIIQSIELRDFSVFDYLLKDEINIDEIALDNAQLFLTTPPTKDSTNQDKRDFHISKIATDNINLNYSSDKFNLQIDRGAASFTDFTNTNKKQFKDIELNIKDMSYTAEDGSHDLLTEQIELNTIEHLFKVDGLLLQPRCSVDEWPSCFPNKKSRITYTVESIIGALDTNSILSGIFLKELEIDNGLLNIISNQKMEPIEKPKSFFMEKFDNLDIPIDISIIKVKEHKIEIFLKEEHIDTISFEEVYATLNNISNMPEVLEENNSVNVATVSKFMDTDLKVDFDFKIKDPLNAYAFKLELEPMPFTNLNKALSYNTSVVIEEGRLQQLDCEVTGNAQISNGQCNIAYEDLRVTIEDQKGIRKKFFTKVLNLIVKNDTDDPISMESKTYTSTLEREENKGFFYQAYTVILQMVKEVMLPF